MSLEIIIPLSAMASKSYEQNNRGSKKTHTMSRGGRRRDSSGEGRLPVVPIPTASEASAVSAGRGTRKSFEKDYGYVGTDTSRDRMSDSDRGSSKHGSSRNMHGKSKHKSPAELLSGYARSKSDEPEAKCRDVHSHRYCDHHKPHSASAPRSVKRESHRLVNKVSKHDYLKGHTISRGYDKLI